MISLHKTGFARMGGAANTFCNIEKNCSRYSFHLKAFAFLNNLIIGLVLSEKMLLNFLITCFNKNVTFLLKLLLKVFSNICFQ